MNYDEQQFTEKMRARLTPDFRTYGVSATKSEMAGWAGFGVEARVCYFTDREPAPRSPSGIVLGKPVDHLLEAEIWQGDVNEIDLDVQSLAIKIGTAFYVVRLDGQGGRDSLDDLCAKHGSAFEPGRRGVGYEAPRYVQKDQSLVASTGSPRIDFLVIKGHAPRSFDLAPGIHVFGEGSTVVVPSAGVVRFADGESGVLKWYGNRPAWRPDHEPTSESLSTWNPRKPIVNVISHGAKEWFSPPAAAEWLQRMVDAGPTPEAKPSLRERLTRKSA